MAQPSHPVINPGKRAIAAGRTGSGKSTLAKWLLQVSPGHWIILNPKNTRAYDSLPDSNIVEGIDIPKIRESIDEFRFTVVTPKPNQLAPETLDLFINWIISDYTNIGVCIDELYAVHKNGVAGEGLIGLLTRGRELKQSFFGLTQRPAWLSKFLFSEADYIIGMSLNLEADRKRMFEFTGKKKFLEKLPERQWLWYDVGKDHLREFNPVPIAK
ncbi:MAG TPA: hypothetical protein VJM50_16875 [Pyrinomonadaceae bacterium]|nr:hypothetical protein [Pyrinomonadaceae bacterium]